MHCDTQLLIFGFLFLTTLRQNLRRIMWLIWVQLQTFINTSIYSVSTPPISEKDLLMTHSSSYSHHKEEPSWITSTPLTNMSSLSVKNREKMDPYPSLIYWWCLMKIEASAVQYIESPHILTFIYSGTVTIYHNLSIVWLAPYTIEQKPSAQTPTVKTGRRSSI